MSEKNNMLKSLFQVTSSYSRAENILSFSVWVHHPQISGFPSWKLASALPVWGPSWVKGGEQAPLGCISSQLV